MRKNFGSKPWSYVQPVYIVGTYDENGVPDAMNAAWGGISGINEVTFCLGKNHKTVDNLKKTGEFTVSMGTFDTAEACDYVGLVSGKKDPDKFIKSGFHHEKAETVNAPLITELPMTLECRVKSYDEETEVLKGKIVNVSADESILTDGEIDPTKLNPISFDPVTMSYWGIGEKAGRAFKDGKKLIK